MRRAHLIRAVSPPNCCSILSADQASSSVMWKRRAWLAKRESAWSEMPEEAASEMTATFLCPLRKASFSEMFTRSCDSPGGARAAPRSGRWP